MIRVFMRECGNTYAEQHKTAYDMLFENISKYFGMTAGFEDIVTSPKGKPVFKDIPVSFNIAHCRGLAVCAAGDIKCGDIGVDCESIRICRQSTAARAFTAEERKFITDSADINLTYTKLWTLKEAYVKYTGTGLAGHMKDVSFAFEGDAVRCSDGAADCFIRNADNGTIVTLCCRKGEKAEFIYI